MNAKKNRIMKSREIKTEIGEKLKGVCESLSEKERKGVLVGMLAVSTVLCGVTVARFRTFPFSRHTKGTAVWQACSGRFTPPDR